MNTLRTLLEDYLAMHRALGFKLRTEGTGLKTFVSYLEAAGIDHITNEVALSWARLPESVQPVQLARRLGFVRGFARYCSAIDSRTQVPPPDLIPATRVRRPPHFFSDSDIEQLLHASLALPPVGGLRRWTFHCLFGLLSVSGLRIGEAIALTFEDVDLQGSDPHDPVHQVREVSARSHAQQHGYRAGRVHAAQTGASSCAPGRSCLRQ